MKLKNIGYTALVAAVAAAFVIGSAATGEAKGKKKTAAVTPPPVFCVPGDNKPVCAIKGGMKFTYADACFAKHDGAKVVSQGACKTAKAHKKAKAAKPAKKMEKKSDMKKPAAKKDDKKKM